MTATYEQNSFNVTHDEPWYMQLMRGLMPRGWIWGSGPATINETWQNTADSSDEYQSDSVSQDVIQNVSVGVTGNNKLLLLLSCFSSELYLIEQDAVDILNYTDPGVCTGEWLESWERVLGLPGDCSDGTETVSDRQIAAHEKLFSEYQVTTIDFYKTFCESLGFTVTVEELADGWEPAECGVSVCGVSRCDADGEGNSVLEITVTGGSGNLTLMKCAVEKIKQAHVYINWL